MHSFPRQSAIEIFLIVFQLELVYFLYCVFQLFESETSAICRIIYMTIIFVKRWGRLRRFDFFDSLRFVLVHT